MSKKEKKAKKGIWKEFTEFAVKGNAMALAVGTIIGGAFSGITKSVTNDLIMPIINIFMGGAEPYTYMMGHYPAPWGNEIRVGLLEAAIGLFFSLVMTLSVLGGVFVLEQETVCIKLRFAPLESQEHGFKLG